MRKEQTTSVLEDLGCFPLIERIFQLGVYKLTAYARPYWAALARFYPLREEINFQLKVNSIGSRLVRGILYVAYPLVERKIQLRKDSLSACVVMDSSKTRQNSSELVKSIQVMVNVKIILGESPYIYGA